VEVSVSAAGLLQEFILSMKHMFS